MLRRTLLTAVILALSASTAWMAIELRDARKELASMRGTSAPASRASAISAPTTDNPSPLFPASPAAVPSPNQAAQSRDPMRASDDFTQRAATLAHNAWVRSWIDDPEKRAKRLADSRKSQERDVPRQLLDLDDETYDRLLDTLATGDVRYSEVLYRCNMDPACDLQTAIGTGIRANRQDLVALLGDEKAQRLENYRDNFIERNSVASFRSGLPESMPLSDAQAEKLADALGDERRRMLKEWRDRGEEISGIGNSWGSLNFPDMQDVVQRLAEATEFQRRQRDRAAEVLTSAQLEIFTKQQEQMLEIARGSWEGKNETGK